MRSNQWNQNISTETEKEERKREKKQESKRERTNKDKEEIVWQLGESEREEERRET